MLILRPVSRQINKFWNDEDAGVTIEFVIWVPVFFSILSLVVDVSLLLLENSRMWQAAGQTARSVALGNVGLASMGGFAQGFSPNGDSYIVTSTNTTSIVSISIAIRMRDVAITPFFNTIDSTMNVTATYRLEPTTSI